MKECNSSQMYEDDLLIRELLHDEIPFILSPPEITSDSFDINNFIPNTYSGPTITDIETALFSASNNFTNNTHHFSSSSLDRISEMEKMSRVENKYILKVKSSGNVMADDGYKWRKYGQKTIKNSSNPRSYYKCTNARCGAKKQVERSNDDPDTLIITYEGLHLHYTYPFFIFGESDQPAKKFRRRFDFDTPAAHDQRTIIEDRKQDQPSTVLTDYQVEETAISSQGLLEDMVPLFVRNPDIYTSKSSSSSSSSRTSPPASPSFSWSKDFDAYLA